MQTGCGLRIVPRLDFEIENDIKLDIILYAFLNSGKKIILISNKRIVFYENNISYTDYSLQCFFCKMQMSHLS